MSRSWVLAVWFLVLVVAAGVVAGIARSESGPGSRARSAPLTGARHAPAAALAPADLRLSEILASPARDWDEDGMFVARQDEWVELRNAGSAPVSLDSYYLTDNDSTMRIIPAGVLQPGAIVVITGRMAEDWQRLAGRTVTGLSLNNAGDCPRCHFQGDPVGSSELVVYEELTR